MALKPYNKTLPPHDDNDCPNCEELDLPTQRSINSERTKYCGHLTALAGDVSKNEQNFEGLSSQYEYKKCLFVWTKTNYQIYQNMVICVSPELIQTTESVKENIVNYIKLNTELSTALKSIFKAAKDVKVKFAELRDQARKLNDCKNDSCNAIQMGLLTGKAALNCKGESKPPTKVHEACTEAEDNLNELISLPHSLGFDIDSIFKSSSEVIGIQVFSNVPTLNLLHQSFSFYSKEFDKQVQETAKLRETDLKRLQEDLVKTVNETSKSSIARLNKRSEFEGLREALDYICCAECDCVEANGNEGPRLKQCECELCDICEEVKETFCPPAPDEEEEEEYKEPQHQVH